MVEGNAAWKKKGKRIPPANLETWFCFEYYVLNIPFNETH